MDVHLLPQARTSPSRPIAARYAKHHHTNYKLRRPTTTTTTSTPPSSSPPSPALLLQRPQQPNSHLHDLFTPKLTTTNSNPEGGGADVDEPELTSSVADVLRLMDCLRLPVEADTYATLLKECTDSLDLDGGSSVHAHLRRRRLRGNGVLLVANRLMLMYVSCGRPESARKVFDRMPVRDSISWSTMIAGCSDNGEHWSALRLFVNMLEGGSCVLGESAGVVCVAAALQSSAEVGEVEFGQCVHGLVLKNGSCRMEKLVDSLIEFYGMMDDVESARMVFEHMSSHSSASWFAMISVCYRRHIYKQVVEVFKEMRGAGKRNTSLVLYTVLKACGRMPDGEWHGRQAHASVIKAGLESVQFVQCSMIEMYGRLGLVEEARKAFNVIGRQKDVACWDVMLSAYTRKGCFAEAVKLLYEMRAAGVELRESMLNEVRLVC